MNYEMMDSMDTDVYGGSKEIVCVHPILYLNQFTHWIIVDYIKIVPTTIYSLSKECPKY